MYSLTFIPNKSNKQTVLTEIMIFFPEKQNHYDSINTIVRELDTKLVWLRGSSFVASLFKVKRSSARKVGIMVTARVGCVRTRT